MHQVVQRYLVKEKSGSIPCIFKVSKYIYYYLFFYINYLYNICILILVEVLHLKNSSITYYITCLRYNIWRDCNASSSVWRYITILTSVFKIISLICRKLDIFLINRLAIDEINFGPFKKLISLSFTFILFLFLVIKERLFCTCVHTWSLMYNTNPWNIQVKWKKKLRKNDPHFLIKLYNVYHLYIFSSKDALSRQNTMLYIREWYKAE